jgi:hypothetical protein
MRTPDEVLDRLDEITSEKNPIRVHGANKFSVKSVTGAASNSARMSSSIEVFLGDGWRSGPPL